ncbi:MAG: hypothetical protein RLZZ450_6442 [Pseudomonadota bacterium]
MAFSKWMIAHHEQCFDLRLQLLIGLSWVLLTSCTGGEPKGTNGGPSSATDSGKDSTPGGGVSDAGKDAAVRDAGPPRGQGNDARVIDPPVLDGGTVTEERDARVVGGGTDSAVPDARVVDTGTPPVTGGRSVFVAVGYSGVRLLSTDNGKTWGNKVTSGGSGDDGNLLRTVTYAKGVFVALGWKIWTSPDAIVWTERNNPGKQWFGGLEYGNSVFVAAGGTGQTIYSSDGIAWMSGKGTGGEAARSVGFGNGTFMAATDPGNWWSTTNGVDWSKQSGGHGGGDLMWCKDKFTKPAECTDPLARNSGHTAFGNAVYVSAAFNKIERSEDGGKTWSSVSVDPAVEDVTFAVIP